MIRIRPVSDLRNRFKEIEKEINEGEPICLTKNGYGTMVIMSVESYEAMANTKEVLPEKGK